jgi:acetyl-CoA acyltransferase
MSMRDAVIVSGARTAVGRAHKGLLRETPPEELAMVAVREALARVPNLDPAEVEDVILGCATPEGAQGQNIARHVALGSGIPISASAMTVNRYCASGLQALALGTQAVSTGVADVVVAGGLESMSMVPMIGRNNTPNPGLADRWPEIFMNMGLTAETVAQAEKITRDEQDEWAFRSHSRAIAAQDAGLFQDEIVPVMATRTIVEDGRPHVETTVVASDEGPRRDTSAERLAALPSVFANDGSVTAGNSSQASDGAAALVVMTAERAASLSLTPLGQLRSFATAGVAPEVMGMGPVDAIPRALSKAGITLNDLSVIELNEAFAAQVVAVVRRVGLDQERTNPNGGAIALGHPMGATGAKLSIQLLSELARRRSRFGLVTMCVGGGQGAAGVVEWLGGRQPDSSAMDSVTTSKIPRQNGPDH